MPSQGQKSAYGFAGLTCLVSDFTQPPLPTKASGPNSSSQVGANANGTSAAVQGRDYGRGPIALVVIVAIFGFIVYANLNDGSSNGTRATANLPSPVTPGVTAPVNLASSAVDPAAEAFEETEPLPGSENLLVLNEIKYCLAQDSRITTVQPLLDHYSHAAIAAYNAKVADFNSRCSQYRYKESDMVQATAAVKAHQAEIESQAQQWLASWQGPKRGRGHSNMNASITAPDNN